VTTTPADFARESGAYPVEVHVDPPAEQNRLSVLLRLIYAIPHTLITSALGYVVGVTGLVAWVIILVTGKCPPGLLRFHAGYVRWLARSYGYLGLLTDKYPPFAFEDDPAYPVRMIANEDTGDRNRLTVFFRIILAIPHFIILSVLGFVAFVVAVIAWFAALGTGTVPEGMHNFLAGVLRWTTRVNAYLYMLNDEYPPFAMN
jgi:hypothetical protein